MKDASRQRGAAVTALILAGGESRRFGRDKARHVVKERSMIRRVYAAAADVAPAVLVSVHSSAHALGPLLPASVRYVMDAPPGDGSPPPSQEGTDHQGPLAGLVAGLEAARPPWVLALACDLPFLTTGVLRRVLDARAPGVDAVVAQTPDEQTHPLCACYRRTKALPRARAHLKAGRLALHDLLNALAVRRAPVAAAPLRNINRPTDL